jgi:hypothetical protein
MPKTMTITATMKTPFIKVGHMTIDGILASQLFDELNDVDNAHAAIPIKQTQGLFHASAAIFEPYEKTKAAFIAAFRETHSIDPAHIKKNKHGQLHKKFDSSLTNVMNSYPVYSAAEITWYAEGDAAEVERLLRPIQFVGKRRASGFGEVESWQIEEGELDGLVGYGGEALRPIPIDMFTGDKSQPIVDAAWRPAYWNVLNRAACYAPSL